VRSAAGEAERLSRITNGLLLLARGDEDKLGLRLERTGVASLLGGSAAAARSRLAAAGLTCTVDVPSGLKAVVDTDRARAAVDALVDNALRFAASALVLAARPAGTGGTDLAIEVRDDGPGFPAGFLPYAFERFRRPDSGRAAAANLPEGGARVELCFPGAIVKM